MAKLTMPTGYIKVTAKARGAKHRDFATMIDSLKATGDQGEILKDDGTRYGSIVTARNVVNALIPLATKAGFGIKVAFEGENAIEHNVFMAIERVAVDSTSALKFKAPKAKATAWLV
jgi:hypothetical protein